MFTVEDFRHAPMRVLATANTREEARAMADAMGLGEHAFISEHDAGQNAGGFESDLSAEEFAHADTKRERDRLLALLKRHGIDPNAKTEAA